MNKSVNNKILFFAFIVFLVVLSACRDNMEKYKRPEWLKGKLYTQILDFPELSTFAQCLELTGYNDIINVSGSYTVFAPNNDAFSAYFASNPNYSSVTDIPLAELSRIVKYHIVQNPWSKKQLRSLDIYGWIDTLDVNNNKPRGFKRSTLLLEKNKKYGIGSHGVIVDTTQTSQTRTVATDSRKYVPIFFSEYFNIYNLFSQDYEFYFNRPFDGGNNLYFANAKITSDEIKAENGIVYIIDQVVPPLKNAYQMLENNGGEQSYSSFLALVNKFPKFEYNKEKTLEQAGAEQGMEVDSLFELSFPQLTFDLTRERTSPPAGAKGMPSNVTSRYHHGLMAPNDQAFNNFVNEYFSIPGGWGSLEGAPDHMRRIIANTYLSYNPIYPSDMQNGFVNGEMDIVELDQGSVIQKEYGSNCTFIGLNQAIIPRAFSSVTGPIYLKQGYSKIMYAIEKTKLLPTLKRKNQNYMLFVESDMNTANDSSLLYSSITNQFTVIIPGEMGIFTTFKLSKTSLRTLLLNHIGAYQSKGLARKEFIPNLAGNYIIVNNETGEISGTAPTTIGYDGGELAPDIPNLLSNADNGDTYDIKNWFSFASSSIFSKISNGYPVFHELLKKAGLVLEREYRYSFINGSEFYTIFIPTEEAIEKAGLDQLPIDELKKALLLHFVRGKLIFTDGSTNSGYFSTARVDEKSTPFSTIFSKIYIVPKIDEIGFRSKDGAILSSVYESEKTNIVTGIASFEDVENEEVFPNITTNAVIHEINEVLDIEKLDTK